MKGVRLNIFGVPVYIHWSLPLGGFVFYFMFTYDIDRSVVLLLSYMFLIVVHELGHALAAVFLGVKIRGIELFGLGGVCHFDRIPSTRVQALILYVSGVVAQAVLLVAVYIVSQGIACEIGEIICDVLFVLVYMNIAFIIFNLLPAKMTSGFDSDGQMIVRIIRKWPIVNNA